MVWKVLKKLEEMKSVHVDLVKSLSFAMVQFYSVNFKTISVLQFNCIKNVMFKELKLILVVAFISLAANPLFSAGSDSDDSSNYLNNYKEAKSLILRADKLEQKTRKIRLKKLYIKAIEKLELAYKAESRNPDVLNYMGYSLRKTGKFNEAENFI